MSGVNLNGPDPIGPIGFEKTKAERIKNFFGLKSPGRKKQRVKLLGISDPKDHHAFVVKHFEEIKSKDFEGINGDEKLLKRVKWRKNQYAVAQLRSTDGRVYRIVFQIESFAKRNAESREEYLQLVETLRKQRTNATEVVNKHISNVIQKKANSEKPDPKANYTLALSNLEKGEIKKAQQHFKSFFDSFENGVKPFVGRGVEEAILFKKAQDAYAVGIQQVITSKANANLIQSRKYLEQVIDIAPSMEAIDLLRAATNYEMGAKLLGRDNEEATSYFTEAAEAGHLGALAKLLDLALDREELEPHLKELVEKHKATIFKPQNASVQFEFHQKFQKLAEKFPNSTENWKDFAETYFNKALENNSVDARSKKFLDTGDLQYLPKVKDINSNQKLQRIGDKLQELEEFAKAIPYYEKIITQHANVGQKNADAEYSLGMSYLNVANQNVSKKLEYRMKAEGYLRKAAFGRHPRSAYQLSQLLYEDSKTKAEADLFLGKAALLGYVPAMIDFGRNNDDSSWFVKAYKKDPAQAQRLLESREIELIPEEIRKVAVSEAVEQSEEHVGAEESIEELVETRSRHSSPVVPNVVEEPEEDVGIEEPVEARSRNSSIVQETKTKDEEPIIKRPDTQRVSSQVVKKLVEEAHAADDEEEKIKKLKEAFNGKELSLKSMSLEDLNLLFKAYNKNKTSKEAVMINKERLRRQVSSRMEKK